MVIDRPLSQRRADRDLRTHHPERPVSRKATTFQQEIERARMRPPTSVPKTYNTYIGSGTAIFHPDKIPMGLQPQNTHVSQTRLSTGRVVKVQSERVVRDKKYYEEVLRVKINQLNNGLETMNADMEQSMKDMGSYQYFKAIVKELAASLTELQGRLADHNLALQKVNVGSDPAKTLAETRELASVNSAEEAALEVLFTDRVRREEASQVLQNQLTKEIHKTDQMIANMNPAMKQRYNDLMKAKTEMQQKAEQLKKEIESVGKIMCILGDQVYVSPLKMEMFESEVKFWDLQNKRNNLMLETKENLEPEEEFKSLLNRIKEDKLQMSTMEKVINEIKEEIKQGETLLMQFEEKNVDEARYVAKYLELRKKELAMDDFLSSVDGRREDELNSLRALDAQILPLLKNLSARLSTIPTLADYKSVSTAQTHVVKQDLLNTVKSVGTEFTSLFRYLNKIIKMGSKIEEDLNKLTKNTQTMSSEMETYSDTADLETKIKQKQDALIAEREILTTARLSTKSSVIETTAKFNETQRQLSESERYAQLLFIEKKLLNLTHSNYAINEYLEEAKSDGYMEERRDKALHTLQILNEHLRNDARA